ncbi:MAG: hypothetical protein WCH52_06965 [Bacteroidota bacterium]
MKKNLLFVFIFFYSVSFLKSKLLLQRIVLLFLFITCFSFNLSAQLTNVFSDNFDRGSGAASSLTNPFTGGSPTATYTTVINSTGTGSGATARLNQFVSTNYALQIMGPDSLVVSSGSPTFTAATTLGSTTLVLSGTPTTAIAVGFTVNCASVPVGTTVAAISGTTVTLSQAATASTPTATISFTTNTRNQTSGNTYSTASTSVYNSLFNNIFANNNGDLIWNFTLKTNRTTAFTNSTPWAAGKYSAAVVIGCTNSTLSGAGAGNGYAVVMTKGTTLNTIKLVKFSGGLLGTQTILSAPASDFFAALPDYVSIKIVYSPGGHYWKLYARNDGATITTDFTGVTTQIPSLIAQDSTYTKASLPQFGFFWIYGSSSGSNTAYQANNTIYFDNYNVYIDKANYTLSTNSLNFLNTEVAANSSIKSFVIDGSNLDANLILTPPANFQISTDSITFVANPTTITIPTTSGTLTGKKIYVRYSPTGQGGFSGDILFPKSNTKISLSGYIRTFYYNTGAGIKVDTIPYWTALTADVNSSHPLDFTHDSVLYKIIGPTAPSQISTNRIWTISGIGTKIVLGDPAYPPIKLVDSITINTVSPVVLDIAKSNNPTKGNSLYMKATDTLLNFGELDSLSEVHYINSPLYNYVQSPNFGKLYVDGKTMNLGFAGTPTIKSYLYVDTSNYLKISGAVRFYVVMNYNAKLEIQGSVRLYKQAGFVSSNVGETPGDNYAAFQFKGAENLILGPKSSVGFYRTNSSAPYSYSFQQIDARKDYKNVVLAGISTDKIFSPDSTIISGFLYDTITAQNGPARALLNKSIVKVGKLVLSDTLLLTNSTMIVDSSVSCRNFSGTGANSFATPQYGSFLGTDSSKLILSGLGRSISSYDSLKFSPGGKLLNTLTLNKNAKGILIDSLSIVGGIFPGVLTVDTLAILNTSGLLTLKSDTLGTARVGNTKGTVSGDVTVERYITPKKAWRLLTMPTKHNLQTIKQAWQEGATLSSQNPKPGYGLQITSNLPSGYTDPYAFGFDTISLSSSIKTWNTTLNRWDGIISTTNVSSPTAFDGKFDTLKAYMTFIRGDRSVTGLTQLPTATILREKGALITGSRTFSNLGTSDSQFIAIPNIYASPIDFQNLDRQNIGATFYLYDPKMSNYGGYQNMLLFGGTISCSACDAGSSYPSSNYSIQSGQGFMVQRIGGAPGRIVFNESSKSTQGNLVSRQMDNAKSIQVLLYKKQTTEDQLCDGMLSIFGNEFSVNVDQNDASKLSNLNENLAIKKYGKLISIETAPELTANDTIFMNLAQMKLANYRFHIIPKNVAASGLVGYLEDKFINRTTAFDLNDTASISFEITNDAASYSSDRFRLTFKPLAPLSAYFINIKATKEDKSNRVYWNMANQDNVNSYHVQRSTDGMNFTTIGNVSATTNLSYSFSDNQLGAAKTYFYKVQSVSVNGEIVQSKIVKLVMSASLAAIEISPNPVRANGMLNIDMKNLPVGNYHLVIYDNLGKKVYSRNLTIHSSDNSYQFELPKSIKKGSFEMVLMQNDLKFSSSFIVL